MAPESSTWVGPLGAHLGRDQYIRKNGGTSKASHPPFITEVKTLLVSLPVVLGLEAAGTERTLVDPSIATSHWFLELTVILLNTNPRLSG